MSALEIKELIHRQVDLLTDNEDIEDLYATINLFFESRDIHFDSNNPGFVEKLSLSLQNAEHISAISTAELKNKMQEWRTK
ncbi:hypothetical protein [Runella sp.]|uniref:hypothetical protein n=1 Tax=Runella sp. TaxID=1960881 RepID=UPI003D0E56DD